MAMRDVAARDVEVAVLERERHDSLAAQELEARLREEGAIHQGGVDVDEVDAVLLAVRLLIRPLGSRANLEEVSGDVLRGSY